jgi:hypothetical protein
LTERVGASILKAHSPRFISSVNAQSRIKPPTPNNLLGTLLHSIATLILTTFPAALSICAVNIGVCDDKKSVPNIVLILADDLGFESIRANGGTSYQTPTLDKLAADGVRFTHCYAQSLCTPTRVQLMTGLSNVRNYINFGTLDSRSITFANLLKAKGYSTCISGKWQLGQG